MTAPAADTAVTTPAADLVTEVAVIGAGTAGIGAFAELGRLGIDRLLIDHGPLGTTCARVGCMPSKAALHAGAQWAALRALRPDAGPVAGVIGPDGLWLAARAMRDRLAGATADQTRRAGGARLLEGRARILAPGLLDVGGRRVAARVIILATGSRPVVPGFLAALGPRLLTTDSLFDLEHLPASIGVLGLGAIGLEMGLALHRLGVRVVAGDMKPLPAGISDPEIGARALAHFGAQLPMWLGQPMTAESAGDGVTLRSGDQVAQVEMVLAALGRRPNIDDLGLEAAGVALDSRGMPVVDPATMQVGDSNILIAGDANAHRPLMHEAVDEGLLAARMAARLLGRGAPALPPRRVSLGIVFADPDIATVGAAHDELDPDAVVIGTAEGHGNGRSLVMGADDNLLRLYVARADGRLLGAALMARHGEHLAHLLAWAIQRGETAQSLLELPFYHPTVAEMIPAALKDAERQRRRAAG